MRKLCQLLGTCSVGERNSPGTSDARVLLVDVEVKVLEALVDADTCDDTGVPRADYVEQP